MDDIQVQNIPVDVDYNDPVKALKQLVEIARQQVIRANKLEEKINKLEEIVYGVQV